MSMQRPNPAGNPTGSIPQEDTTTNTVLFSSHGKTTSSWESHWVHPTHEDTTTSTADSLFLTWKDQFQLGIPLGSAHLAGQTCPVYSFPFSPRLFHLGIPLGPSHPEGHNNQQLIPFFSHGKTNYNWESHWVQPIRQDKPVHFIPFLFPPQDCPTGGS